MHRQRALHRRKLPQPGRSPDHASGLARYANRFEVGYNAFEFLFNFAQDYDHGGFAHSRIVTVPAYAKVFLGVLHRSIIDYEAQFGQIPLPPGVPGADS